MLSFIYTENYKNLKFDGKVDLKNLNIFIGPNGSGKSNLISYLKFLNQCLVGSPDPIRQVTAFDVAASQLGRILDTNLPTPSQVRFIYGFSNQTEYSEGIVLDTNLYIDQPLGKTLINVKKDCLYKGTDLEENLNISSLYYNYPSSETGEGLLYKNNNQNYFSNSPFSQSHNVKSWIIAVVRSWQFYNSNNMNLEKIRTTEPKIGTNDVILSTEGDNLALVIDSLIQLDINFEEFLNLAMKSIFPKTRRIRSARVGRLSLTVEWFLEGNNEPFYLNEMSDGTVRMLCWAVILHSPYLPALLVIDEPELGLHPAWLSVLAQWIKKAAEKTQIILTTHSPDLLDHFTDYVENVYSFEQVDATHYGLKPLSREILQPQLDEGWELGDLYRIGDPTIGAWP
ncbi:MAG: AAA family ATPase [Snowella sp.]|nr:AAA family ATPase [Snowella sp.]